MINPNYQAPKTTKQQHDGITCPTCHRNFPGYPDFTAHIGNPTCANEAVIGCPKCGGSGVNCCAIAKRQASPPDRRAASADDGMNDYQRGYINGLNEFGKRGIGKLDVHDLAELRSIILTVIDGGRYYFYEGIPLNGGVLVTEAGANDDRLDFCDAIQQAIINAAAPATRQPAVGRVK